MKLQFPTTTVRVRGVNASIPIFDTRDGSPHESLAMKTPAEFVRGFAWNAYMGRGVSGIYRDHEAHLLRKVRDARKAGETVLLATIHNYGVEVCVAN
jgi:hypothetical protein